jgi:hypothetical protein
MRVYRFVHIYLTGLFTKIRYQYPAKISSKNPQIIQDVKKLAVLSTKKSF